jgi:hypothetical protein
MMAAHDVPRLAEATMTERPKKPKEHAPVESEMWRALASTASARERGEGLTDQLRDGCRGAANPHLAQPGEQCSATRVGTARAPEPLLRCRDPTRGGDEAVRVE